MACGVPCHHMNRMQIQFTDEQVRKLRRLAAERGVSIAAVVREAVEKNLMIDETDAKWRRALAVVGKFSGAEPDISEDHDRYLAEDFR